MSEHQSKRRDVNCWREGWCIGFMDILRRNGIDTTEQFSGVDGGTPWQMGVSAGKEDAKGLNGNDVLLVERPAPMASDRRIACRLGWFSTYTVGRERELRIRSEGRKSGGFGSGKGREHAECWLKRQQALKAECRP